MPSKHPRIAVTADPELGDALERVRAATGTREADASLVRRLAVEGAEIELQAGRGRREAIEALFAEMDRDGLDLDLEEIDRVNSPPSRVGAASYGMAGPRCSQTPLRGCSRAGCPGRESCCSPLLNAATSLGAG